MIRLALPILLLCILATCKPNPPVFAFPVQSSYSPISTLENRIKAVLPPNWSIAYRRDVSDPHCTFLIRRQSPVLGHYVYPNPPLPTNPDNLYTPTEVLFTLQSVPFVHPQDFQKTTTANTQRNKARLKFEKKLQRIPFTHIGGQPIPPRAYHPKTDAEKNLVQAYADLWLKTEPTPLPDYTFDTMSFRGSFMDAFQAQNPNEQKEIQNVRQAIIALIQYPEP